MKTPQLIQLPSIQLELNVLIGLLEEECKPWSEVKAELRAEYGARIDGDPVWHDVLLEAGIFVI